MLQGIGLILANKLIDRYFTDEHAKNVADKFELPVYQDPVEALHDLEDDASRVYVWDCGSKERASGFLHTLEEQQQRRGRPFDAVHFVMSDKEQIHEYSREELKQRL